MEKKLLTMMCVMFLLATATGCSSNLDKSDSNSKNPISSIFSKKEDKYSVESIEKKNFKEAKNIPKDDDFNINADKLTGEFCQDIAETYYNKYNWLNNIPNEHSLDSTPSEIQIINDYYKNKDQTGGMYDDLPACAKVSFIKIKETLSYKEAKDEYDYLKKNIKKYFGNVLIDHSAEKNWHPQYDNGTEVFGIRLSKANSTHYKIEDGDYQLELSFSLYALTQTNKNLNTKNIKNGFIWLGLDKFYNSEYKCTDAYKMNFNIPFSEAIEKSEHLDLDNEDEAKEYDAMIQRIDTLPIISISKMLKQKEDTYFSTGKCVLL